MRGQENVIAIIEQLNNGLFANKKIGICCIYIPFKKEYYAYFILFLIISKKAAFLPHCSEKLPHIYRIILKNYRMSTALFKKITACLPHYFEKLPHVYRIFSFLKDMRHRIMLKKSPHVNTALDVETYQNITRVGKIGNSNISHTSKINDGIIFKV